MDPSEPPTAALGPYRGGTDGPRYVCTVCYQSLSRFEGACRRCGVARLALSDPAVREQVRAEAERRLERRKRREDVLLYLFGVVFVAPLAIVFFPLAILLYLIVRPSAARIIARLFPGSATATLAARRLRTSRELGVDVQLGHSIRTIYDREVVVHDVPDKLIADTGGVDPEAAEFDSVLSLLGAHVDDGEGEAPHK